MANALIARCEPRAIQSLQSHIISHELSHRDFEYDPQNRPALMQPLLVESAFDPAIVGDEVLCDLFARLNAEGGGTADSMLRVYVDGMLSPRYESEILHSAPHEGETLTSYLGRVLHDRKFGVIINGAERWSDPLGRLAASTFAPCVDVLGQAVTMIEVTLFIGNYGYTPFGIHVDDPFTSVTHFHVGPGSKAMTLFEPELFRRLNGNRTNCFEPSRLTEHGTTHQISPGDLFLLPPHYYHVGSSEEFSVAVAIAVSKYTGTEMTRYLMGQAIKDDRYKSSIEDVIESAQKNDTTLATWLEESLNHYQAQARSRSNLRYSFKGDEERVTDNQIYTVDDLFPLVEMPCESGRVGVYVRGNPISMRRSGNTVRLLELIREGRFSAQSLFDQFQGQISKEAIGGVMRRLHGLKVLQKVG